MKTIDHLFSDVMLPKKALIIYQSAAEDNSSLYVEAFDMDGRGKPINAHPLSIEECAALAKALNRMDDLKKDFLVSRGLLPEKILYISTVQQGYAVWYTPPQQVKLLFKKDLTIPCGEAHIPAMLWKADRGDLYVYALKGRKKPNEKTPLYFAPYFNLYNDGRVCMGTVDINIENNCCLEEFMSSWEHYFFDSYFSHLIADTQTVNMNMVQLWQQQVGNGNAFPEDVLVKSQRTIKSLIV